MIIQKNDTPLVSHLVIYVNSYKIHHKNLWHGISQVGKHYLVPDKAMPAGGYGTWKPRMVAQRVGRR